MSKKTTEPKARPLTLVSEFKSYIQRMLRFFKGANITLGKPNPGSGYLTVLTNPKVLYAIFVFVCFVYLIATQTDDISVLVLQIWTTAAVFQLITRGINGVVHLDDMNDLLTWYQSLYEPVANPEYQAVIDEYLKKQNYYIQVIMK